MKIISAYTHLISLESGYFLFNIANEKVIAVNKTVYNLILECRNDIESLKVIHPDLYKSLVCTNMIVEENVNENEQFISNLETQDKSSTHFGIIINPTLDCNLRCWYCYETHGRGTMMSDEVISSLKELIGLKVSDPKIQSISIGFFGGEPLIGWDKVVIPVLEFATKLCHDNGKVMTLSFTTNGVLLTNNHYDKLIELGLEKTSFQISFDGHRALHDKSRIADASHPTYNRIMENVGIGASKGFKMNLRFNYTPENIASFRDVITDLEKLPEEALCNVSCDFQQVWQTSGADNTLKSKVSELIAQFHGQKIRTSSDIIYHRHVCYADSPNEVVINFDGNVYKCTAREFSNQNREGVLTSDGEIKWNERYFSRMAIRYSNKACRRCKIMPICNAGCTQNKLERKENNSCPYGMDEVSKDQYIIHALMEKIDSLKLV